MKLWLAANSERKKLYDKEYYKANRQRSLDRVKARYAVKKDEIKAYQLDRYHKDAVNINLVKWWGKDLAEKAKEVRAFEVEFKDLLTELKL